MYLHFPEICPSTRIIHWISTKMQRDPPSPYAVVEAEMVQTRKAGTLT